MTQLQALGFKQTKIILENYNIPVLGDVVANDENELILCSKSLDFPLVLKAHSKSIIHKSDVGGVILDIQDEEELILARNKMNSDIESHGLKRPEELFVQKMAKRGFELLIGGRQDPVFGPLVMVGTGGKFVELYGDTAPGIGLLSRKDVEEMLSETKAGDIINGYRGEELNKETIVDITIAVSKLLLENPDILEIDLNPVLVYEDGCVIVDTRIIKGPPLESRKQTSVADWVTKSLGKIFDPESVVIFGASELGTIGGIILKNCLGVERIYPVNPNRETIQGKKCYRSVTDIPEAPDLGIFVLNASATVTVFEEFCKKGGKGAIIIGDGYSEVGRNDLEERLITLSLEYGVAYLGPNCMGAINNFSGLNTFFTPEHRTSMVTEPNGIGIISQSGGIGVEILEMLHADNLKLGKLVSIGNASGVGVAEVLQHMGCDDRISVIAMYLEGMDDGELLMEIGKKVSKKKPVLVIKGGVGGGAEATLSHTASLAGDVEAFRACCRQAGFYMIESLTEDPKILVNILSLLTTNPRAKGDNIAVVSVGGGAGVLLADQVTAFNMNLADFTDETKNNLNGLVGVETGFGNNPVDLLGNCDDKRLIEALKIIDQDENTDGIVLGLYLQVPYLTEYFPEKIVELKQSMQKPMIVSIRGFSKYVLGKRDYLYNKNFHTYTIPMVEPMSIAFDIWQRYEKSFVSTS